MKKVEESVVDEALVYNYIVLLRPRFFDGDLKRVEFGNLGPGDACTDENQLLAIEAAKQGIVLPKNHGALPLSKNTINNLEVIGPNANVTTTMVSDYPGLPCCYTSPLNRLMNYMASLTYEAGCHNVRCADESLMEATVKDARGANVVVLVVRFSPSIETGGLDWVNLTLSGFQEKLVMQVTDVSNGSVILVIMLGGPVDVSFAENTSKIRGILWVVYLGEDGGVATAQVIFGDYNPSVELSPSPSLLAISITTWQYDPT